MVTETTLGGSAKGIKVAKVAHGLMMMSEFKPTPPSDEDCFESIKGGIDAASASGARVILNSGEFYAPLPNRTANLHLITRFFTKYPQYADKTFLSVKGGTGPTDMHPDCSEENLRRSIDVINQVLGGKKKLDLFEPARVDPKRPIEETMEILVRLQKEGKFDHIGLSECSAATLRRANAVAPIAMVEFEVSPTDYEDETRKDIATAHELDVAVLAYSPLGRGILTGQLSKKADFEEGDYRRNFPRFQEENSEQNVALIDALAQIAQSKGITPAQLSIAWVSSLGNHVIPLPGSSNVKRTLENLNAAKVELTEKELKQIDSVLQKNRPAGARYPDGFLVWG